MAPIRARVLSANSPGVLALSQGRADLFALRPPWRPFAATRPQIYADGRKGGACRRAARTVLALRSEASKSRCALLRAPARRHPHLKSLLSGVEHGSCRQTSPSRAPSAT